MDDFEEEGSWSIEDEKFDQIYPARIRKLSPLQWTPVRVAAEAARLLVTVPGTRVLDIGCGPGKFCLVAGALSDGHFTGIEQRADLAAAARKAAAMLQTANVKIIHGNIMETAFADYDAFYLYNPFEENMARGRKIDSDVPLPPFCSRDTITTSLRIWDRCRSEPGSSPTRAMPTKFRRATVARRHFFGTN